MESSSVMQLVTLSLPLLGTKLVNLKIFKVRHTVCYFNDPHLITVSKFQYSAIKKTADLSFSVKKVKKNPASKDFAFCRITCHLMGEQNQVHKCIATYHILLNDEYRLKWKLGCS